MFNNTSFYNKHNDSYAEMVHNAATLKKAKHAYNVIGWIYIAFCGYCILTTIMSFIDDSVITSPWGEFFDGIVFKVLLFYYGYFACYKHNSAYALIAVVVQTANALMDMIFFGGTVKTSIAASMIILIIALTAITIMTNRTYTRLEQEPGFPYFNQRFEEQKIDRTQREIKDEYTQIAERYKKTETAEMSDFTAAKSTDLTKKSSGSGMMDSI